MKRTKHKNNKKAASYRVKIPLEVRKDEE